MVRGLGARNGAVVMGRHAAARVARRPRTGSRIAVAAAALVAVGAPLGVAIHQLGQSSVNPTASSPVRSSSAVAACSRQVRVVTASSFVPVLTQAARSLASGPNCVAIKATVADGQGAANVVASSVAADVWISDDASWRGMPNNAKLSGAADSTGEVLATSPMYLVTLKNVSLPPAESSWVGLAAAFSEQTGKRLVVCDPAGSGDGLVAAGAMSAVVFKLSGAVQSALESMRTWQKARTVTCSAPAFPQSSNEVGVVPEYELLRSGQADQYTVTAPTDSTAMMRFTWNPTSAAAADPSRSAALNALHDALTGPDSGAVLAANGLRGPTGQPLAEGGHDTAALPVQHAKPLFVLPQHLMWHVLTTWHPDQRKVNILVVVDVSGSMGNPASSIDPEPLISVVKQGVTQLSSLLPATSYFGLWKFGYQLSSPNDYQVLVPPGALDAGQHAKLASATPGLAAQDTGTALYNTILAAYHEQQAHYQNGMPNEVLIFTDGKNEDAPDSISIDQLKSGLAAADPKKRVQIAVLGYRNELPVDQLTQALSPVGGQVDSLHTANDVLGAFVHAASGGLTQ
jgi:Bacterial extracellular solute-binding protein/von Willebrand factor type A domain